MCILLVFPTRGCPYVRVGAIAGLRVVGPLLLMRLFSSCTAAIGAPLALPCPQAAYSSTHYPPPVGSLPYDRLDEGGTYSKHVATLPAGIDAKKCTFRQADACNLPEE